MRAFLNLVALVCLVQLAVSSIVSGHPGEISSEEVAKKLNESELSPLETYELLYSDAGAGIIFQVYKSEDFDLFTNFAAEDCSGSRKTMLKRVDFIKELETKADDTQAYQNLINFCTSLYREMVHFCNILEQSPNQ